MQIASSGAYRVRRLQSEEVLAEAERLRPAYCLPKAAAGATAAPRFASVRGVLRRVGGALTGVLVPVPHPTPPGCG